MILTKVKHTVLAALALFLAAPLHTGAQSPKEGLTSLQLAKMKQVGEIAIEPSGKKAIYMLRVQANPLKTNQPAAHELHLVNLATGRSIPFVTSMNVHAIAFRPEHNTATFLSQGAGDKKTALFEISLSGGEAHKLLSFPSSIAGYSWGPDGNHLAFMAPDTTEKEPATLPYKPEIYEENLTQRRGFVTNISRKNHEPRRLEVEGSIYQMRWNPDGKKLAVAVAPSPLVDDYYMHQQVLIVDPRGRKVFGKVDHEGKLGEIRWSPDGNRLAMIGGADIHDPVAGRLFVVSAEGGQPTLLQPNFDGMFEEFSWASNKTLYYLASRGVWSTYGTMSVDGRNMKTIIDKGGPNLSDFDRSRKGTTVLRADTPGHPPELYRLMVKTNKLRRLTNSNPWLDNLPLGRQEVVKWQGEDGTELQGILVYPLNFQKGKRYPLITAVHGGPEAHIDHGWVTSYMYPGQVAAAQGYFVFYPNYRGSSGRGKSFAKSSQGDPAGAEFDDIVRGVDELVKVGVTDSTQVGVTGASYGGYATGWLSTKYTSKFDAGVMFVGVSNNISKWGTSNIPEELYLVHTRQRIWEDYQFFLERSPIYYAGQTETPLLIMAGKEDQRVDPGQSFELYRHIKTRTDTPVRLVLYPGEGHGNTKSTARYDYNLRMMRWFNKYLNAGTEQRPDTEIETEADTVETDTL